MGKSMMDIIAEQAVNERLDAVLMQDKAFLSVQKKVDRAVKRFDRLGLSRAQRLTVDRMVSAYVESGAYHSAAAYKQGFRDCAGFLAEIVPEKMEYLHWKEAHRKCGLHKVGDAFEIIGTAGRRKR